MLFRSYAFFVLLLGLSLLVIFGCSANENTTITTPVTALPSSTISMPAIQSSREIEPILTTVPIPTPTKEPIIVPTLNTDDAYIFLQNLIHPDNSCRLPCWGGINPGTSTNVNAETILRPLSRVIYGGPSYEYKSRQFLTASNGKLFTFEDVNISFLIGWYYEQGKDTVEVIQISTSVFQDLVDNRNYLYGDKEYDRLFEGYNLHNILSRYGIPTRVLTFALVYNYQQYHNFTSPNPEEFQLILLYDQGIMVEYRMPLIRTKEKKDIGMACPSQAFTNLWLVSSKSYAFYQELLSSETTESPNFLYRKSLDDATQMNLEKFYQEFGVSNNPCFEVHLNIWPEH